MNRRNIRVTIAFVLLALAAVPRTAVASCVHATLDAQPDTGKFKVGSRFTGSLAGADPINDGATLTFTGSAGTTVFTLIGAYAGKGTAGWKELGSSGFKYIDRTGTNGSPRVKARVKVSSTGTITASFTGNGTDISTLTGTVTLTTTPQVIIDIDGVGCTSSFVNTEAQPSDGTGCSEDRQDCYWVCLFPPDDVDCFQGEP